MLAKCNLLLGAMSYISQLTGFVNEENLTLALSAGETVLRVCNLQPGCKHSLEVNAQGQVQATYAIATLSATLAVVSLHLKKMHKAVYFNRLADKMFAMAPSPKDADKTLGKTDFFLQYGPRFRKKGGKVHTTAAAIEAFGLAVAGSVEEAQRMLTKADEDDFCGHNEGDIVPWCMQVARLVCLVQSPGSSIESSKGEKLKFLQECANVISKMPVLKDVLDKMNEKPNGVPLMVNLVTQIVRLCLDAPKDAEAQLGKITDVFPAAPMVTFNYVCFHPRCSSSARGLAGCRKCCAQLCDTHAAEHCKSVACILPILI